MIGYVSDFIAICVACADIIDIQKTKPFHLMGSSSDFSLIPLVHHALLLLFLG
jgi:hypothetical protein